MTSTVHASPWRAEPIESDGLLRGDASADACVVGAGIAGISIAHELARRGRSVIVVEDGEVGSGETSHTTAHLTTALDDRYYQIERMHGEKGARLSAGAQVQAIDRIERVAREESIDCGFLRLSGYLYVPEDRRTKDGAGLLGRELEAVTRAGLECTLDGPAPMLASNTGPCLVFPRQAQFEPMDYLAGLCRSLRGRGGRIHTGTHVDSVEAGRRPRVRTHGGLTVEAGAVVVATNTPVNDRVAMHTKQLAYRTYVVGMKVGRPGLTPALLWDGFWGEEESYHYVRLVAGRGDVDDELIIGGADHQTGRGQESGEERFASLEAWARGNLPVGDVTRRWSGQVMEPIDGLYYIGRNFGDENVYIVTGDSGNGMTNGTIAAEIIPDLIDGVRNELADLFDPARKTVRTIGRFAVENAETAAQYFDWLRAGDVKDVEDIEPGQGAIVRRGLSLVAAYRDPAGRLTERSAVCTHLGGVVRWNAVEGTWDCPCHGSRFDVAGRVLNGPAITGLGAAAGDGKMKSDGAADGQARTAGRSGARV